MIFLLITATVASAPNVSVSASAEATIQVLAPVTATKIEWEKASAQHKREIVRVENDQRVTIRVIDNN